VGQSSLRSPLADAHADFQNCGPGDPFRDVVYCMSTALTIDNRRAWQEDLVPFYLKKLQESGGPALSEADAWKAMRLQSLTALAFWTLTLGGGDDVSTCCLLGTPAHRLNSWTCQTTSRMTCLWSTSSVCRLQWTI
jgi:hypothetical protein